MTGSTRLPGRGLLEIALVGFGQIAIPELHVLQQSHGERDMGLKLKLANPAHFRDLHLTRKLGLGSLKPKGLNLGFQAEVH